jgi:hypothetical protein
MNMAVRCNMSHLLVSAAFRTFVLTYCRLQCFLLNIRGVSDEGFQHLGQVLLENYRTEQAHRLIALVHSY